jgi:hypothetical protein
MSDRMPPSIIKLSKGAENLIINLMRGSTSRREIY